MARKYDEIDVIKLMAGADLAYNDDLQFKDEDKFATHNTLTKKLSTSHVKWNEWLTKCYNYNNLEDLIRVRYGIQVGMDSAAKKKLNTNQLNELFCRWIGSIDKTARRIIKKRYGLPKTTDPELVMKVHGRKKSIDHEFEKFLRKASF